MPTESPSSHHHHITPCSKCGGFGPFYASLPTICKECHKAHLRGYYIRKKEWFQARDTARTGTVERLAQKAVKRAVDSGKIERQPCWVCGDAAEAHHPDYSRPLDVVWLCRDHHAKAHAIAA